MNKHFWTFLYVPQGEGGVRTLHLDKRLVGAFSLLVLLFLTAVGVLTTSFVRQHRVVGVVAERDREIRSLRETISELEISVSEYEALMAENRQLQERANLLAGLGPLEDSALPGVGGRAPLRTPELEALGPMSRDRLVELREQLDRLLSQARSQKDGFERVLQALRDDQRLRDGTPSIRPIEGGYLSSRYGRRVDPFTGELAMHRGIDFSAPVGTPIVACASGKVTRASRHGSLGKLVEVDHGNGVVTRYGHMHDFTVKKGQYVQRGDVLGSVGNSGRSTGPHVHYEVIKDGRSENPWFYIIRD